MKKDKLEKVQIKTPFFDHPSVAAGSGSVPEHEPPEPQLFLQQMHVVRKESCLPFEPKKINTSGQRQPQSSLMSYIYNALRTYLLTI